MLIAYVVSAIVATVLATLNGPKFPDLPYWRRWDRGAVFAALGIIGFLYAASGLAVTALAEQMGWTVVDEGTGQNLANGAAYGVAAAALLRLEVTSFGLSTISPARTIYNAILGRLSGWLYAGADRGVQRAAGDLSVEQMRRASWYLAYRYVIPPIRTSRPWAAAADIRGLRNLHGAARRRNPATGLFSDEAVEAQELLRFLIEDLIISNRNSAIEFGEDERAGP